MLHDKIKKVRLNPIIFILCSSVLFYIIKCKVTVLLIMLFWTVQFNLLPLLKEWIKQYLCILVELFCKSALCRHELKMKWGNLTSCPSLGPTMLIIFMGVVHIKDNMFCNCQNIIIESYCFVNNETFASVIFHC